MKKTHVSEPTYEIIRVCDPMHVVVEETTDLGPKRPAGLRCYVESVEEIFTSAKYRKAWENFVGSTQ